jgi:hypothetical protein
LYLIRLITSAIPYTAPQFHPAFAPTNAITKNVPPNPLRDLLSPVPHPHLPSLLLHLHHNILSRCQHHLHYIDVQRQQLQSAKRFLVRNKLLPKGLRMAIEEGDMEHWEILLERRERVGRMWEDEKRGLERKGRELDRRGEVYVEMRRRR